MTKKKWKKRGILNYLSENGVIDALRLAALLHDLGHGPFSHALENIAKSFSVEFNHDDVTFYLLTYGIPFRDFSRLFSTSSAIRVFKKEKKRLARLENFRKILSDHISLEKRQVILSILNKKYKPKYKMPRGFSQIRFFLFELLKGDIGTDRLDYLLRDTYFTGLGHRFNLSDVLDNIRGIYNEKSKHLMFAVDSQGKDAVDFLLTTRYYHYRLIANHPTNFFHQVQFQKRIQKALEQKLKDLTRKQDRTTETFRYFLKIATDDDTVEKQFRSIDVNFREVDCWKLGEIGVPWYRYLFYRIICDKKLRDAYFDKIKNRICQNANVNEEDIHVDAILEKPHIPILHRYKLNYLTLKSEKEIKDSPLFHDYSSLVIGLSEAYLGNTCLFVYSSSEHSRDVSSYVTETHSFFLDENLFTEVMGSIRESALKGYDLILAALDRLTDHGAHPFFGIGKFFKEVEKVQGEHNRRIYDSRLKGNQSYDPQGNEEFLYPPNLFNDLFLFDATKLVEINVLPRNVRKYGKPRFSPVYEIVPAEKVFVSGGTIIPLRRTLEFYPSHLFYKWWGQFIADPALFHNRERSDPSCHPGRILHRCFYVLSCI